MYLLTDLTDSGKGSQFWACENHMNQATNCNTSSDWDVDHCLPEECYGAECEYCDMETPFTT